MKQFHEKIIQQLNSLVRNDRRSPLRRLVRSCRRALERKVLVYRATHRRPAHKGTFIGITGSSAKTTTCYLLNHVLDAVSKTRLQAYNNGFGRLLETLAAKPDDSDYVIVELGASGPGSISEMAAHLQPNIGIITTIGTEHYSAFRSREAVALEKGKLAEAVLPGGFAVLNADDPLAMEVAERTKERVVTYGRENAADYQIVEINGAYPDRLKVVVRWRGGDLALQTPFLAEHFWLPTIAAAATALELGVAPDIIAARIATFEPLTTRFGAIVVPEGPHFILDTAKAPWDTIGLAIEAINKAKGTRKRFVMGQMSDFPGSTAKYRLVYQAARAVFDQVIFVGDNAHRSKASSEDRESERFLEFKTTREVTDYIKKTAIEGEVILLKGSQNLHLERIAMSWVHNVQCWELSCRKSIDCLRCGLYEVPFEKHRQAFRERREHRRRLR